MADAISRDTQRNETGQLTDGIVGHTERELAAPVAACDPLRYLDATVSVTRYELDEGHGPSEGAVDAYLVGAVGNGDHTRVVGAEHKITDHRTVGRPLDRGDGRAR
jgi:hypothetical protein